MCTLLCILSYTPLYAYRITKPLPVTDYDERGLVIINDNLEKLWDITNGRYNQTSGMFRQGSTWHVYGGFQSLATIIAVTQNVYAHITNATNNLWVIPEAVGVTVVNDAFVFENPGDYFGTVSIALSALNGKDYFLRCMNTTTNIQQGYVLGTSTSGAGNYSIITLPLYLEDVKAGDTFQFQITCITDGTDPTIRSAIFYIAYLHD